MGKEEKEDCSQCGQQQGDKRIGALNGPWSVLFRFLMMVALALLPFHVAFGVWQVTQIYDLKIAMAEFVAVGPRYTKAMSQADHSRMHIQIMDEVARKYPPADFRDLVKRHEDRISRLEGRGIN